MYFLSSPTPQALSCTDLLQLYSTIRIFKEKLLDTGKTRFNKLNLHELQIDQIQVVFVFRIHNYNNLKEQTPISVWLKTRQLELLVVLANYYSQHSFDIYQIK